MNGERMIELAVNNVTRAFPDNRGVYDLSLTVERGEFFVLLGPSGAGKSTLLRMIAGLDRPDSGDIEIGGRSIVGLRRPDSAVAMVFQSLALYPHMSAFDNIAFPLRMMRLNRRQIEQRVRETATLAGLQIDLSRRPGHLSGGERQRVALARALVREPSVILMDEPLSQLDTQLRNALRLELKEFQRRTGRTIVYVTHDHASAFILGDRIAVMQNGTIAQVGRPAEIYRYPANLFVASFLGDTPMNLIKCQTTEGRRGLWIGQTRIELTPPGLITGDLILGIRPEDLSPNSTLGAVELPTMVEATEFLGTHYLVHARLGDAALIAALPTPLNPGEPARLYASTECFHFFELDSGKRLA
jgi:multiple sugar transport system ATP-binding protein